DRRVELPAPNTRPGPYRTGAQEHQVRNSVTVDIGELHPAVPEIERRVTGRQRQGHPRAPTPIAPIPPPSPRRWCELQPIRQSVPIEVGPPSLPILDRKLRTAPEDHRLFESPRALVRKKPKSGRSASRLDDQIGEPVPIQVRQIDARSPQRNGGRA